MNHRPVPSTKKKEVKSKNPTTIAGVADVGVNSSLHPRFFLLTVYKCKTNSWIPQPLIVKSFFFISPKRVPFRSSKLVFLELGETRS
ncbi:hypothetical protein L1887_05437 [Cichorium endivia]|nr:hypothetical protein L1887_05437 [Cichorium endivia]